MNELLAIAEPISALQTYHVSLRLKQWERQPILQLRRTPLSMLLHTQQQQQISIQTPMQQTHKGNN